MYKSTSGFSGYRGMGQIAPVYNQDAFGIWCSQNPTLAVMSSTFPELAMLAGAPANSSGFNCAADALQGGQSSIVQTPVNPTITSSYVTGSAPAVPPEGYYSGDAQDPYQISAGDTIQNILANSQASGVSNATAAAAAQAAANSVAASSACISNPGSFACILSQFWQQYGTYVLIGGAIYIAFLALKEGRR